MLNGLFSNFRKIRHDFGFIASCLMAPTPASFFNNFFCHFWWEFVNFKWSQLLNEAKLFLVSILHVHKIIHNKFEKIILPFEIFVVKNWGQWPPCQKNIFLKINDKTLFVPLVVASLKQFTLCWYVPKTKRLQWLKVPRSERKRHRGQNLKKKVHNSVTGGRRRLRFYMIKVFWHV